jgi:SAM-dependent methyltransferase
MKSDFIRQQLRNFYDQSAADFSRTRKYWWKDLDLIKEHLPKNGKFMDFGCGNGRLIDFLNENNFQGEYHGVDISRGLIAIAAKNYPKSKFSLIEREDSLPFKSESFDVIMAIAVFHHFDRSMAQKALFELSRTLKPGGVLILTVWNLWNRKYIPYLVKNLLKGRLSFLSLIPFQTGKKKYWRHCYWWRLSILTKIIKKTDLEIARSGFSLDRNGSKRNIYFILRKSY